MRRAAAVMLVVVLTLSVIGPPAHACGVECVALGLASFAVFTQLVSALTVPRVVYTAPGYYAPAYYGAGYYGPYSWSYPAGYAPAPYYPAAYYPSPYYASYRAAYPYVAPASPVAWTGPRVVQYAHGRYELRGDGVSVPYAWVWVPSAPASPVAAPVGPGYDGPGGSGVARTP
jgi:hypothetical protein